MTIAIDLGTSNTVISRWNPVTEQPETLKLPGLSQISAQNPPLIPSLLYVENAKEKQVLLGQQVRDRGYDLANDPRFFRNFKRGIGSNIQGFLPEIDGEIITFETAGEWFLKNAIAAISNIPLTVDSLIFTVPVDSFETYRNWLGRICESLEVPQVRMIDEPTAAALGYGLGDRQLLLVIDFGGGTLDLSLVRLDATTAKNPLGFILKWGQKSLAESSGQKAKTARVIAKSGQNLGGSDIDYWLVDDFVQTQGLVKNALTTRLAEKLKIQLSLKTSASEVYFNEETFESYELEMTRDRFNEILAQNQFFDNLDKAMAQVLQQARRQGIEAGDIDAVLLVGGTVQIPAVQDWVKQYFNPSQIRSEKPFEAISHGALQLSLGTKIEDFLYHSYGVRYWNRRDNCHDWHPIIKSGQPYPMTEPVELLLGASLENQPSIELVIGELGDETGGTEVFFDGDRLVTRSLNTGKATVQPLNDSDTGRSIAKLTPPGNPGSDRIRVQFQIDEQRFLRITVEDLLTSQTLLNNQTVVKLS
ncbi:Hsp70 family protein [Arthrospira platensis]|uniref:DnaK family protein n=1 Tax=Limnospira platensis NIES-46 TaxID=1236695 RepID=A0A5M3T8G1_LIMPL|nr:Hsp70 family protein [Arthrospira platensis]AMW28829.1 molecular chaperone DnaK [Arthrospira platensis YZ]MBD2668332.1 Hsp70 family protein [Arthrospira platensis FACHB-439]MBD2709526.1 Hsp70 family protein [Arthrospira platensis FACHB-835]MDT9181834.1 Hsp70 family protein [Limnospira sp. PMC 289.06]QQW31600.1 Hsp70 family protein [Arthrospira sp. PCC 9108]